MDNATGILRRNERRKRAPYSRGPRCRGTNPHHPGLVGRLSRLCLLQGEQLPETAIALRLSKECRARSRGSFVKEVRRRVSHAGQSREIAPALCPIERREPCHRGLYSEAQTKQRKRIRQARMDTPARSLWCWCRHVCHQNDRGLLPRGGLDANEQGVYRQTMPKLDKRPQQGGREAASSVSIYEGGTTISSGTRDQIGTCVGLIKNSK
mmetsp:Transcript_21441/g.53157  ORF Transcript_21441/g.53157 Transcript_21441/m.53157 type:complete len:209 (-) Transcript_21441:5883-6509(-)